MPAPDSLVTKDLTIPEGLDLVDSGGLTSIRRRWFSLKVIPILIFAIIWDAFLVFWYTTAFKTHGPWIMVVFPLGHVAVGIGITYFGIASLFNTTIIDCNALGVRVITAPLPWLGNCAVRKEEITKIVTRERSTRQNGMQYNIMYADTSRKERKLVQGIPEYDQAKFIEQVLKNTLGLSESL